MLTFIGTLVILTAITGFVWNQIKKQQDIKYRYIERMGIEDFIQMGMDGESAADTIAYVDTLRQKIDAIKDRDQKIKKFAKDQNEIEKLEFFMV